MNILHPELEAAFKAAFAFRPTMGRLPVGDVEARRASVSQGSGIAQPPVRGVTVEEAAAVGADGAEVPLRVYRVEPQRRRGSALVYIHGGGLIAGSLDSGEPRAIAIAAATGMTVVSVGYRLAPEHPFPVPLEDCYAALSWTAANTDRLGVAPRRIAVGGESAGGGLAAAVGLLARDRGGPGIAGLYLACPMLDPRVINEPRGGTRWYTWSHLDNETGWRAYLPELKDLGTASGYAAPALAPTLSGLPRSYIDVGGLDLFRDENIEFAARLWREGVACELHVVPGAPHGFVALAPDAPLVRRIDAARNDFLKSI